VTLPYWSLDGRKIAFVGWQPSQNGAGSSNTGDVVRGGEIFVADADGTAPTADPKLLVPRVQGRTETYPALSDDSALVAFTETRCDGPPTMGPYGNDPCDGYDDPSAKVRLVASAGGAPVDLARANGTDTWTNSWPRFSPKHGTFRGQSLYWLTFSTRRPYGLRLAGSNNGATHPQLWVAAVVLDPKAGPSGDPSFAPVWIPGQNTDMANPTGNHVPQWVSEYVPIIK
jgi:hypothetical protein